jgi:hypothetical protein
MNILYKISLNPIEVSPLAFIVIAYYPFLTAVKTRDDPTTYSTVKSNSFPL